MTQKKTFNMSLVWDTFDNNFAISHFTADAFTDGVRRVADGWIQYLIREIEIEVDLPADFDPIAPQLAALNEREKQIKAKYQLDLTNIEHERQKLLAIENKGA